MKDPRIEQLARQLISYSCEIKKNEKILIELMGFDGIDLLKACIRMVYEAGGIPFYSINDPSVAREFLSNSSPEQITSWAEYARMRMKNVDAYIGIKAVANTNELSDVPPEKMQLYMKNYMRPVHQEERIKNTKWVVLRYPNSTFSQMAAMSTEACENMFFSVCTMDYASLSQSMTPLVDLINKTDSVHIVGDHTDITFSIKGMGGIKCDGRINIPDGEVFTAPVRDSVNGIIHYNIPALYFGDGFLYQEIYLTFENGKIINARANNTERINRVFDTDDGSRYIGEFAFGVNPKILRPINDSLFDEKITGSFHLTPGNAYEECNNGNISSIHWDLVCMQTPEYGGGEIYFDGRLIRKNGLFVIPELTALNP